MQIVNLTPHQIVIVRPEGDDISVGPSGRIARVWTEREQIGELNGIALFESKFGEITGLPEPEEGVVFIVSGIVRAAVRDRDDVFAPGKLIRDDEGRVVGCEGLTR